MKIGSIRLDNKTILAPLAGITNLPFRLLAKSCGCGMVCSEMISSNGLVHGSPKTLAMLKSSPEERPLSIQIFGSVPEIMADAAQMVASSGAAVLDINFGCSVKKIVKTGSGVDLMRNPAKAEAILTAVRKVLNIPLTIKIRSGWDKSGQQALIMAKIAESCGVDAIAVHPRTASQGFGGNADWKLIHAVKKQVSTPVVGNGDIVEPDDAMKMFDQTGCDAVMIGRAAVSNPWIFSQITALLNDEPVMRPTLDQRRDLMYRFLDSSARYFGERQACLMMRSRLGWLVKGLPNSSKFREAIKQISTQKQALTILSSYMDTLKA